MTAFDRLEAIARRLLDAASAGTDVLALADALEREHAVCDRPLGTKTRDLSGELLREPLVIVRELAQICARLPTVKLREVYLMRVLVASIANDDPQWLREINAMKEACAFATRYHFACLRDPVLRTTIDMKVTDG